MKANWSCGLDECMQWSKDVALIINEIAKNQVIIIIMSCAQHMSNEYFPVVSIICPPFLYPQ